MKTHSTSLERRLLKTALRASGLPLAEIAQRAGITARTLAMVRSGFLVSPRMRRRLEATLGLPIWTAKSEFQSQQAIAAWLGFDPWVLNLKVVRTLASQQGILIGGMNPSKALVLARLQDAFEASHHAKASPKTPSPPVTGGADR